MFSEFLYHTMTVFIFTISIFLNIFKKIAQKSDFLNMASLISLLLTGILILYMVLDRSLLVSNIIILILLLFAFRTIQVSSLSASIKYAPSYEVAMFSLLAIPLTYTVDVLMGSSTLNVFSLIFVLFIFTGLVGTSYKTKINRETKYPLLIYTLSKVGIAYIAYIAISRLGIFNYLFILLILSIFIISPLLKTVASEKHFSIQTKLKLGLAKSSSLITTSIIAFQSATIFILVRPLITFLTIVLSTFFAKKIVTRKDFSRSVSEFLILIGIIGYIIIQFVI